MSKKTKPCFTLVVSAPSENQCVDACGGTETEVSVDEIIPVEWATQCVWWAGCCGAGGGRAGHASADAGEEVSWMNFDLLPPELLSPCSSWKEYILWEYWALRQRWIHITVLCMQCILSQKYLNTAYSPLLSIYSSQKSTYNFFSYTKNSHLVTWPLPSSLLHLDFNSFFAHALLGPLYVIQGRPVSWILKI